MINKYKLNSQKIFLNYFIKNHFFLVLINPTNKILFNLCGLTKDLDSFQFV